MARMRQATVLRSARPPVAIRCRSVKSSRLPMVVVRDEATTTAERTLHLPARTMAMICVQMPASAICVALQAAPVSILLHAIRGSPILRSVCLPSPCAHSVGAYPPVATAAEVWPSMSVPCCPPAFALPPSAGRRSRHAIAPQVTRSSLSNPAASERPDMLQDVAVPVMRPTALPFSMLCGVTPWPVTLVSW
jgi:hypothetical protein